MDIQTHAGEIAKLLVGATYGAGCTSFVACAVDMIDRHNWIPSAVFMCLTFIGSMIFKYLDYKARLKYAKNKP